MNSVDKYFFLDGQKSTEILHLHKLGRVGYSVSLLWPSYLELRLKILYINFQKALVWMCKVYVACLLHGQATNFLTFFTTLVCPWYIFTCYLSTFIPIILLLISIVFSVYFFTTLAQAYSSRRTCVFLAFVSWMCVFYYIFQYFSVICFVMAVRYVVIFTLVILALTSACRKKPWVWL
jgi:hypothetical protein